MITPDANGLYHPRSEDDVIALIRHARANRLQVRVRGAAQSVPTGVFADEVPKGRNINIQLDKLRGVTFDKERMRVTVQGGTNLHVDPRDPTSSERNGLYFQLNKRGWALPNVPAAAHQTVAGFLATGSAGGSTRHSFDECVVAITLIDGTGERRTFTRTTDKNDPFYAMGSAMGLMGVVTAVTLQCVPGFNVIGSQATLPIGSLPLNFLGKAGVKKPSVAKYFANKEYARMLWWPFRSVQRMITWDAHTMRPADYKPKTTGTVKKFKPKPYQPTFPAFMGSTLPARIIAAYGYLLIGTWPDWLVAIMGKGKPTEETEQLVEGVFPSLYPKLLNMFFPETTRKNPPQQFWDNWSGALEMDQVEFSDELFNMVYTEIWVDLKDADRLVQAFQSHYQADGTKATWFYCVEILGGKSSDFWMSPGYGRDSLRLSINWWARNSERTMDYYQQFWDLLYQKGIPFRLHWGKYLPPPSSRTGASYLQKQYPRWVEFMTLRKKMDPDNIFLNRYWRDQLGIS